MLTVALNILMVFLATVSAPGELMPNECGL